MESYPQLIHRKSLAVQQMVWEALWSMEAKHGPTYVGASQAIAGELQALLDARAGISTWRAKSPDSERFDAFVGSLCAALIVRSQEHLAGPLAPGAATLAAEIARQKSVLSCSDCCTAASLPQASICTGGLTTDNVTVARGGFCLREYKELFGTCLQRAREFYATHAPVAATAKVDVRFNLNVHWATRPPSGVRFVDATTRRSAKGVTVTLIIIFPGFNQADYLVVYYILMHELIAHAFANSVGPGAGEEMAPPECQFDEGWMDGVLGAFFGDLTRSIPLPHTRARLDAGEAYHLERHNKFSGSDEVKARRFGRDVGLRLLAAFQRHTDEAEGLGLFARFSVALNLSRMPWEEKDLLVALLGVFLPLEGALQNPAQLSFDRAIMQYVENEDLGEFILRANHEALPRS